MLYGIDHAFVAHSFRLFRELNRRFPFVDVPAHVDISYMIINRPLFTVAVCSSASSARPEAQDRLTQAFRHAISSKLFILGEKSMDIMLGLLVHVAWSHYNTSHARLYQNLHLLAAMAADQGLYGSDQPVDEGQGALERHRAFIGSYYLCANLSELGLAKPSPMSWTDNLYERARNLARVGSLPSDPMMPHILEIAHTVSDFHQELRLGAAHDETASENFINLHSLAANRQLDTIRRECPAIIGFPGFRTASLQIHHRALRSRRAPEPRMLIQCSAMIKDQLDNILSRPAATLHQLPITDWTGLLDSLVLMARLSRMHLLRSRDASGADAVASMLQPEVILDTLCAKMASAPIDDPLSPRNDTLLRSFIKFCEELRKAVPRSGEEHQIYHHSRTSSAFAQPPPRGPEALLDSRNGILDEELWQTLR
jgi:hypothetical protein